MISRSGEECTRERSGDLFRVHKNPDPLLHPFQQAREYARALNATKLERAFAKPFVASLDGHRDGVYSMAKDPHDLSRLASGSADGIAMLWNLATRKSVWSVKAHEGFVRGTLLVGESVLTCGDDKVVRLWRPDSQKPHSVFQGASPFTGVDGHRQGQLFATSGDAVNVWDACRAEPVHTFAWGADTVSAVRFNQAETSLLASCATDRSVVLHDLRTQSSLAKVVMQMRGNAVCWSPTEAVYFSVGSEDHSCYTFDMRFFDKAVNVLRGHVSAVLDLDYAPTGDEIVTAGYDRSLRIFNVRQGHSRDIYHTRRMQRLFCVKYSMDAAYVFSGSDDGCIRVWKAHASDKLGVKAPREQAALDYAASLKERFKELPDIKRISRHRHIPKAIASEARVETLQRDARKRKTERRAKHSKPGAVKQGNVRKDVIVAVKK